MTHKEEVRRCIICKEGFNWYYTSRRRTCSDNCQNRLRRKQLIDGRHKTIAKKRLKHLCFTCGKIVNPIIVYHTRCDGCLSKKRKKGG